MEWNRKSVQVLIEAYKDEPLLFDYRHPQYHVKSYRKEILKKVAQKVREVQPGVTPNDCKSKFATLRSHYGAELKKMRTCNENGKVYSPTVWWFPLMDFLRSRIIPRSRSPNSNNPERVLLYKPQAVSMDSSQSTDLMDSYNLSDGSRLQIVESRCTEDIVDSGSLSDGPRLQIVESRCAEDVVDSGSDNHSALSSEMVEVKTEIDMMPSGYVTTETQDATELPETHHQYADTHHQYAETHRQYAETHHQHTEAQNYYEKPSKRQKKDDDDTLLLTTLSMLEKVCSYLDRTTEDDTFSKFVAEELRKMDNYICIKTRARHRILQAIMDAQMEIIHEIQKTNKTNIGCSNCTK